MKDISLMAMERYCGPEMMSLPVIVRFRILPVDIKHFFIINLTRLRLPAPCPDPGRPYQGNRIGEDFRHDRTVTFTCPKDYIMVGLRTITCSDGRWRYRKPSCKGDLYFPFMRVKFFFCHPPGQFDFASRGQFRLKAFTTLPCLVLVSLCYRRHFSFRK